MALKHRPQHRFQRWTLVPLAAATVVALAARAADQPAPAPAAVPAPLPTSIVPPASKLPDPAKAAPKKPAPKPTGPRNIEADRIEGVADEISTATGNVTLDQQGLSVRADRVDYDDSTDTAYAQGGVVVNRDGDIVTGTNMELQLESEEGFIDRPNFFLTKKKPGRRYDAWARATHVNLEGKQQERFFDAEYTTCRPGDEDWYLRASELALDHSRSVGTGYHGSVMFKGVPILYLPYMTFPLDSERKSGFLPPSFGSSSTSGLELALPYYVNISPDMDATLTPKIFTRRGLQLGTEYRYLERTMRGEVDVEYLPSDRLAKLNRYLFAVQHVQDLGDLLGKGWAASLNAQKVSDDNYFRDLSTRIANTAQTNLPRDLIVNYNNGLIGFSARTLSYQTLQDPAAPVLPPYRLEPQLILNAARENVAGFDVGFASELTDFRHPSLVNGQRLIVNPSLSFPITRSFGFFTPKIGYHYTQYQLDGDPVAYDKNATRSLPIASLDSGLIFERQTLFRGVPLIQTLEPRLYYLYVPYRDQSRLPNFSTAESDFNFAQIFTENRFIGGDRVADANQATVAVTSRFIEGETGFERLRTAFGQRFYFAKQRVTLSGPEIDTSRSDLLAAVSGQVTSSVNLDTSAQYSTNLNRLENTSISARYSPEFGKILNVSYRYTRDTLKQVDLSAQWPVKAGWGVLARLNHSLQDKRLLEGLLGVEYNQGCWEFRLVAHRFTTATQQYSNSIQFQLELKGLSKLGINTLETLRQNIPGYRRSDETVQQ